MSGYEGWLRECDVDASRYRHWWVDIRLRAECGTQLDVHVDARRWGLTFVHSERCSAITFVGETVELGRDDHGILHAATDPSQLGSLLAVLEDRYGIEFRRQVPEVRSNIPYAVPRVRQWLSIV